MSFPRIQDPTNFATYHSGHSVHQHSSQLRKFRPILNIEYQWNPSMDSLRTVCSIELSRRRLPAIMNITDAWEHPRNSCEKTRKRPIRCETWKENTHKPDRQKMLWYMRHWHNTLCPSRFMRRTRCSELACKCGTSKRDNCRTSFDRRWFDSTDHQNVWTLRKIGFSGRCLHSGTAALLFTVPWRLWRRHPPTPRACPGEP